MKKVLEALKTQVKSILQTSKLTWHQSDVSLENDIQDFKEIMQLIENKTIIFQSNVGCNDKTARHQLTTCEDTQKDVPKKRGRKPKTSSIPSESKGRSDNSDCKSLNDSTTSTSSTRSRRAAAQDAEHKMAHVQSLGQLNTKLRRPTNFDEKQVKAVSSPPAKCRRTHRNQSAGSSSSLTDEGKDGMDGETNKNTLVVDNENLGDHCSKNIRCLVSVTKLNTPTIKSFTHPNSRSSRSLDRASKRKSEDLFNDSIPLSELISEAPNSYPTHKTNRKKSNLKKDLDSGISSNEEELQQLLKANMPIAHSSPISLEPIVGEFKGFDDQCREAALVRENTFIVGIKTEETQVLFKKTLKAGNHESSSEEIEQTETNVIKSKTKVLRKKGTHTINNAEEKENVNRCNETRIITSQLDDSPNLRTRTRVLKKATDHTVKNSEGDEKNSEEDMESLSSPETRIRSRTKTIRKQNEQHQEFKSSSEVAGQSVRSRTKTIKKDFGKEDQSDSTDDESSNMRSRIKTIKKGTTNLENNGLDSEYLISEIKDNLPSSKMNRLPPSSPAPAKGELVKKRVEDFEKMQNGMEDSEEERTVGRVTRNALKSKATATANEAQSSKQARNIPVAKLATGGAPQPLSLERPRMTPLGINNRMTPALDSAHKPQANKWTSSANRPIPVESNSVALIHKQVAEEVERKRKEEDRLKRQAKEEEAKKKKEKALKATAEEARRKRVEKLQKVAATREAAEKEKERLAAKAEKEKEEKMRQIAIEKEKQKEEQLKKKQLIHQKTLEHEERRKQEEAARLAKIKEQEEEQKRVQAMKEREQELLKQQKADIRLAEAEKIKNQGGKLAKIAAVNNAKLKMQHGVSPPDKANGAQSSNCYEITPAREDRPLLPPKTENDYGIDDAHSGDSSEDESQPRKMIPAWAQSKNRERLLLVNKYIPKTLWDLFMECDPCPDINKIFAGNPIKRRIRTSSAVWRTPPKYSRVAP